MGSICLFSALISAVERSHAELLEVIEMSRRAAERQADAMIGQLELEVKELRRRESTLAELAQLDDPTHCVKVGEDRMRLDMWYKTNLYSKRCGPVDIIFKCILSRYSPHSAPLHPPKTGLWCQWTLTWEQGLSTGRWRLKLRGSRNSWRLLQKQVCQVQNTSFQR